MPSLFVENVDPVSYRSLKIQAAKDSLTLKAVILKLIALYIRGKIKLQ